MSRLSFAFFPLDSKSEKVDNLLPSNNPKATAADKNSGK
jgi:hypothetical protein